MKPLRTIIWELTGRIIFALGLAMIAAFFWLITQT